jgi:hypothetical protein
VEDWNREEAEEDDLRSGAMRRLQERYRARPRSWHSSGASPELDADPVPPISVAALKGEMEAAWGAGEGPRAEGIQRQIIEIFKTAVIEGGDIPGLFDDMGAALPDDMDHVVDALTRRTAIGFRAQWAANYDAIARKELGLPQED